VFGLFACWGFATGAKTSKRKQACGVVLGVVWFGLVWLSLGLLSGNWWWQLADEWGRQGTGQQLLKSRSSQSSRTEGSSK